MQCATEVQGVQRPERDGGEGEGRILRGMVTVAFGLNERALVAEGRGSANVAFARQVAIYLAHTHLGLSFTAAGALFRRDRSTARHACHLVEDRRDDPRVDDLLGCLERGLNVALGHSRLMLGARDNG